MPSATGIKILAVLVKAAGRRVPPLPFHLPTVVATVGRTVLLLLFHLLVGRPMEQTFSAGTN